MARAAGDSTHYTFRLTDKDGVERASIALPSVTTIVHATLAAPALVPWAYRQTVDSVAGATDYSLELFGPDAAHDLLDTLSDPDMLDEWLHDNKLTPNDVRDERAVEGQRVHDYLERLATRKGGRFPKPIDGYEEAVLDWWKQTKPSVIAAEQVLYSVKNAYAGTADLVRGFDARGFHMITDLKTRRAGAGAYVSDYFQLDGYAQAYEEMTGIQVYSTTVLVAREDGTVTEYVNPLPRGSFLKLREVYDLLRSVK